MKIQAVKTTGIYCRADCSARPNADNVRTMLNPIAAMAAGYRPCLICRPDRLPDFGLDRTSPEIAHAVRLISEGFLDDKDTEELAQRVGYSGRHLVRLFEQHIGASPDFVARARRAHVARRLLDETNLKITDVALASGFSSVRQMNRVMQEMFAFSPTELRSKRKSNDVCDPLDGGLRLRVPYDASLNITRSINFLKARAIPGIETVEHECYKRTTNTCGHPGVVEIVDRHDENRLNVTMHLATFGSIVDQVDRVRSLFRFNDDQSEGISELINDKLIGPTIRQYPGIRLPGAWDRFETSIRIIIGQQISVAGASTLAGRLVERFGERLNVQLPGTLRSFFPTASKLANAKLTQLGMPQARANTIQRFARAIADGEIDLTSTGSLDAITNSFEAIPGIGPWTSHFIAGRVMGNPDAFPAGDLGLRRSASRLLRKQDTLSASDLSKLADNWRPYRALAAAYLWMSPDKIPASLDHKNLRQAPTN